MHKPSIVTLSSAKLEWHDMELGMFFHFDLPIYKQGWSDNLVELDLQCPERVNHVLIMEDIACGERILEYAVETLAKDGTWQTLCTGEYVGHKRIEQFDAVVTSKIRLKAISTKAKPHVRRLSGSPFRGI